LKFFVQRILQKILWKFFQKILDRNKIQKDSRERFGEYFFTKKEKKQKNSPLARPPRAAIHRGGRIPAGDTHRWRLICAAALAGGARRE
jgi:hypothetical protein